MTTLPAIHVYRCRLCGELTVTVQLHAGDVLDSISCRARGFAQCRGAADLIETPANVGDPRWEWVNVRAGELERMPADENHFVREAISRAPLILQSHSREVARAAD